MPSSSLRRFALAQHFCRDGALREHHQVRRETETLDAEIVSEIKSEYEKQTKVGIQPIVLSPADAQAFVKKSNEVAWESIIAKAPVEGKKLRELAGN